MKFKLIPRGNPNNPSAPKKLWFISTDLYLQNYCSLFILHCSLSPISHFSIVKKR
jgi:hypothetical protein